MKLQPFCMTRLIIFFVVFSVFTNPLPSAYVRAGTGEAEKSEEFMPPLPEGKKWKLAWRDEFSGAKSDESRWEVMGDWRRRDGFWVKEDSFLDDKGNLVLRTKKDNRRYTCGAVRTKNKFEHKFGYWVARCKFPKQQGHWPAFWLHIGSVVRVGNEGRDGTEIDIMEKPWREDKITQNLHLDGYGREHKHAGKESKIPGISDGFHTFGLHWKPDEYVFYVDGKVTWRTSAGGVSQVPEYMKLTEEIGKWGGDITKAELPDYFLVDYVRVYDMVEGNKVLTERDVIRRAASIRPSARQFVDIQILLMNRKYQEAYVRAENLIRDYAGDNQIGLYLRLYAKSFYLLDEDYQKGRVGHITPPGIKSRIRAMKAKKDKTVIDLVKLIKVGDEFVFDKDVPPTYENKIKYANEILNRFPNSIWTDWAEWVLLEAKTVLGAEKYRSKSPEEISTLITTDLYNAAKKFIKGHPNSYMLPCALDAVAMWKVTLSKEKKSDEEAIALSKRILREYPDAEYYCACARLRLRYRGVDCPELRGFSEKDDRIIENFYCGHDREQEKNTKRYLQLKTTRNRSTTK